MGGKRFWTIVGLGLLSIGAAQAADIAPPLPVFTQLPAVDGLNGKAQIFGGGNELRTVYPGNPFAAGHPWRASGGGAGSLAAPLGPTFGVQIDGLVGTTYGRTQVGAAAHLFTRDPARGLLGAYGSVSHYGRGNSAQGRFGAEAEGYLGSFTISGIVGVETGRRGRGQNVFAISNFGLPYFGFGAQRQSAHFFDKIDLSFYVLDNLKLSVGHRYTNRLHAAAFGGEWLLPVGGATGVSAFVEGRIGERRYAAILGGVRVYFGGSAKTLIRRHREDDPPNYLVDDMLDNVDRNRGATPVFVPVATPAPVAPAPPLPPPA